ncbi:hypothetical protein [Sediminibacterium sp.]|uniref:hypothetical protein n=1 Tax=Sediminibacterium sp. TaxID=1917865 RepID=UPI00271849D4|nr:hypothetical protein [Sediminibacterium sp.]MDO8997909.1 hypothetical protein [Sediminibacterium sp.]MDO9155388.1 hypothetical protein [Sediminibacterium sp.]MDP1971946.1 hypothetical protein [Sediminibacterium sp.]MDP2422297.1 hypothetical protein [Sediminibacterium sp.]
MKKGIILLAILAIVSTETNAQLGNVLDKAKSATAAAGFDINALTGGIMGKLAPALTLTAAQKPKVTNAITEYLSQKAQFIAKQKTNPAEYSQRQMGIFQGLKSKLAGILVKNQMNKFLGLKPATNDPANVLSQLFF